MEPSRKNHHHHNHHNHHHHQGQNNTTANTNSVSNATVPAASTATTTTPAVTTTTTAPAAPQSPQQQNKQQDVGTSAKKKKDRENRNSISQDLSYDWSQKGDRVSVTVVVGFNQDNRTVDIRTDETSLGLYLTDGRRFSTQLYAEVVPEVTAVFYKGPRCIVRLQKRDANLHWPQLESVKKLLPPASAQDCILPTKTKSTSTSPGRTPEKKQLPITTTNSATNTTNTTTPSSPTTPVATPTTPTTTSTATSTDNNEELIPVVNAKSDFVERDAENLLVVYLYVKGIKKETACVEFSEDAITARFSTSDGRFLQQYPGSNEESVFEWHLNLKDKVVLEECKYKVMPNNIEMKLRKQANKKWGSLTAIPAESSPSGAVAKNTWVTASKMDSPTGIPPAPPVPPLLENKKPMCLVSPVSKGMRGITSGIPASSNSFSSTSSSSSLSSTSSSYSSSSYSASGCEGATGGSIVPRGTTGLDNIGNTCFMNSVLQCLINTQELKGYFLDYNYHEEINKDNPLGMGGKLAVSFACLMKLLWSGSLPSHAPTKLKATMSLKANQFSGFAQHDAQEFMVELLDGLHEDLNRVKKKPYVAEPPDLDGWPDRKAAQESWKLHKMRNDSIIDDLFKGQFKSTLKCHECGKISVKFDEFCCLSVPIPKDQKVIPVVFFWKDPYQKPKKFFIRVPASATAEDLRHELCERTGVQACCIQIFERLKSKIHKIYEKGSSLSSGSPNDPLMAFEVYNPVKVGEPVVEVAVVQRMMIPCPPTRCAYCSRSAAPGSNLRRCTKCYRAGYCDQNCQRNHWHSHKVNCKLVPEQVGCPFILSLPESHATYSRLARVMEAYARYSVDIFQPPVYHSSSTSSHRSSTSSIDLSGEENDEMEVRSGDGDAVEDGETQERDEARDEPMTGDGSSQGESPGPWENKEAGAVGNDTSRGYDEPPQLSSSPSVRAVQPQQTMQLPSATQLFVIRPVNSRAQSLVPPAGEPLEDKGDEPLDLSDKRYLAMDWKTSEALRGHCLIQDKEVECEVEGSYSIQRNQPTTLEACIELFTQPENLSEGDSWRCPRCKKPVEATKQMSVWRLPHVLIIQLKRFSFKYVLCSDKIDKFVQYPIRGFNLQPYMSCEPEDGPAIYDLYGVINHMGRLLGGHYTSYARLFSKADTRQSELDWRLFDDSRVSFCPESRVVNEQAYLLLYRRRDTPFTLHRLPPPSPPVPPTVNQEENGMEHLETEEATPMSISSASQQSSSSQPSSSSLEGEEQLSTTQEELD